MATGDLKPYFAAAPAAFTITLASLATSSTLVAGRQSTSIVNASSGNSAGYSDYIIGGLITGSTSAQTAGKNYEVWVIAKKDGIGWPDTFGASDANVTITTRTQLASYGKLLATFTTTTATSEKMDFQESLLACLGYVPREFCLFVVQNSGQSLNSTGGNHVINYTPIYHNVSP